MTNEVTYERPIAAKLVVRLDNGEEWPATTEDLTRFGLVNRRDTHARLCKTLQQAVSAVRPGTDLDESALNAVRVVLAAVLYCDQPVDAEDLAALADLERRAGGEDLALRLHLASAHALGNSLTTDDPHEVHEHEHDGPGTIRNHPREDVSFDPDKAVRVLAEGLEQR